MHCGGGNHIHLQERKCVMASEMFNKQGDSKIVANKDVQQHLSEGWTFQKPAMAEKPKSVKTKKVQLEQEPAESSLILEAEATAEVIKNNNKKEN